MHKTQQPPTLHSAPVTLKTRSSKYPFFTSTIRGIAECEAFPDSGSKATLTSKARVRASMIVPGTEPPVAGVTVLRAEAALLMSNCFRANFSTLGQRQKSGHRDWHVCSITEVLQHSEATGTVTS
ncbi:hypothetical protein HPB50_017918 [Hyalomma asiaticum]|uniref:Uncharacterized protein n=1 Tax=Hyalomma asiaticum TaxID=266040 RepID=A0ACB7T550_HYAAI|nr:hypothetical protein HPB50_017918 [Hyalomma asiaticum]